MSGEGASPRLYLSTSGGKWRVIYQGGPLCRDTTEAQARAVYAGNRRPGDPATPPEWNGDTGSWKLP